MPLISFSRGQQNLIKVFHKKQFTNKFMQPRYVPIGELASLWIFFIKFRWTWERLTQPQRTIYSATTFLESCRKVVREKWFEKSGLRNLVWEIWFEKSGWPEKKVVLYYKSTFFSGWRKVVDQKKIRVWRTILLEPLFYTFPKMRSQNKRSSGPVSINCGVSSNFYQIYQICVQFIASFLKHAYFNATMDTHQNRY